MDEIPDFLVARVKNMGAIGMDVDAFDPFRVAIASDMAPLVDQKAALTPVRRQSCKGGSIQTASNDQVVEGRGLAVGET